MHLYIDNGKYGHKTLYVKKNFRKEDGKTGSKIIERLGRYDDLLKEHEDPIAWAKEYIAKLNEEEKIQKVKPVTITYHVQKQIDKGQDVLFDGGYLFLQKWFYSLGLDKICQKISRRHDFYFNLTTILSVLVYGRILFPTSKLGTFEYSKKMLEKYDFELQDVYRALDIIAEEKDYIQAELYKNSLKFGKRNDKILYYDCTNYYFEIEQESGMRKYGRSKENRPNPIVEMGLFMDGDGVPLAFCLHDGNINEQKTLQPLEKQIIQDFGKSEFVVCTDAGLASAANRRFNDVGGRAFITVQSLKKMKCFQEEWALEPKGWHLPNEKDLFDLNVVLSDLKLYEKYKHSIFYKEQWFNENNIEQRFIVTFSIKYMNYQRMIRNEQIERAKKALSSSQKAERTRQSDFKRFITKTNVTENGEIAEEKVYSLNKEKIAEEEKYDGFYCVATDLMDDAAEIIRINRKRWEIEESFRIMKSEFSARPVYLHKDNRITAHFTTCFISLMLFRLFEKSLGHKYTVTEIIKNLKEIKFFKSSEGYMPAYTRTEFTDVLHDVFGTRTDYEIIPFSDMKKIFSYSKKSFTYHVSK